MTLTITIGLQAARAIVYPIAPALTKEVFWSASASLHSKVGRAFMGTMSYWDYKNLAGALPSLPQRGMSIPFIALRVLPEWTLFNTLPVGRFVALHADAMWEGIHLTLLGLDIYAGQRAFGTIRLACWTYYKVCVKYLPAKVDRIVQAIFRTAVAITIAAYLYHHPYLALTLTATSIIASAIFVSQIKKGLYWSQTELFKDNQAAQLICEDLRANLCLTLYRMSIGTYVYPVAAKPEPLAVG